mgnify:CR=1 FL=1
MRQKNKWGLTASLIASLVLGLTGCGGQNEAHQTPKVAYASVVSFGDSLSDPGAYQVGQVAQLGGGLFTVNGIVGAAGSEPVPSYTWAQLVSASVTGQVSCAARTGGFGVPVTNNTACTNYAQGGSRVTDPNGTGHANGALTEPIVTQVANYLSRNNGVFTGNELVTVQGGANELFAQAGILTATATAVGNTAGNASFTSTLISMFLSSALFSAREIKFSLTSTSFFADAGAAAVLVSAFSSFLAEVAFLPPGKVIPVIEISVRD